MNESECAMCKSDIGLYLWDRDCCLARFINHLPDEVYKSFWLDKWLVELGTERVEHIKELKNGLENRNTTGY
jgi:hypothetical protein